jgi:hypothetical protein
VPDYLSKVLSGCIRGLGPCGPGSNPGRETSFRIHAANLILFIIVKKRILYFLDH